MGTKDNNHDSDLDLGESGVDLDAASSWERGSPNPQSGPQGRGNEEQDADVDVRAPRKDLAGLNLDGLLIQRKLGEGGMGEVWLALDEDLDIPVAVKVLPSHLAADQGFVMRFLREARAVARLDHSNVVRVLQAGKREVTDQILRVMVMEYVEGQDAHVALKATPNGKLEPQSAAEIALACAKALKYAHGKGVVHRDVKPANILISKDGKSIKLLDFGLAKLQRRADVHVRPNDQEEQQSSTHTILGTPSYMPPEQCEGRPADGRADIYSLGITLFELLTGKLPFEGDTVFSIIEGHVRKPLEFPHDAFSDLPPLFTELIGGMCEKKPDDRWTLKQVIEKLQDYFGISVGGRTSTSAQTAKQDGTDGDVHPPTTSRTNLQKRKTSFIGRDSEMKAIGKLIEGDEVSLVTVVGPGGVGKTRITQEYGLTQAATPDYPGGVWFCDLTEARSVDGICYAVSQGIGVPLTQADSLAQIEAILSMRDNCLIIFDNFEQVVDHAGETLGRWMAKAPKVKFITSSREPLHLEGERPFPLQPLSSSRERGSPDPQIGPEGRKDEDKDADVDIRAPDQEHPPAIQLFIDRASVAKRGFKVDEASLSAISKIADQLDGIPLAIELAASRCSALSPQKLLERLPRRFDLLKGRRKDASARQATLRGAIDWSWNLLESFEKSALAQCSVFQNGFFLEAAEAVIDLEAFDDAPFEMDVVEALVEKSLLVSYEVPSLPGETRYRMLESIRQYASEKLAEVGVDTHALLLRHAEHYVEYAEEWDEAIHGPDAVEALDRIELELENLIGIQEALDTQEPVLAARAILSCAMSLHIRGPWNERTSRLQRALEAVRHASGETKANSMLPGKDLLHLQVRLSIALTRAEYECGSKEGLMAAAKEVERFSEILEGDSDESIALRLLATQAQAAHLNHQGEFKAAAALLDDALSSFASEHILNAEALLGRSQSVRRALSILISNRGVQHLNVGAYERALECFGEAEGIARKLGHLSGVATNVGNRGSVFVTLGETDRALECYLEAEAIERELGNLVGVANDVSSRGNVYVILGKYEQALKCYAEAEAVAREMGHPFLTSLVIVNRGLVHERVGQHEQAVKSYAEAEVMGRKLGHQLLLAKSLDNRGSAQRKLGRFEEAWSALGEAELISRKMNAIDSLAYTLLNKAVILLAQDKSLDEGQVLALEALEIRTKTGQQKTGEFFYALATLSVIEKRLGDSGTSVEASDFGLAMTAEELLAAAKEHAEQAKALGEELKLDRHERHGPKKGEVTEFWQYVDEVLGAGKE